MAQKIHIWTVQELNLEGAVRGDDFSFVLSLTEENKDFTGTSARMQARKTVESDTVLDLVAQVDTSILGECTLTFTETAANTSTLLGDYLYDVELTIDGSKKTYVAGKINFKEDITR